MSSKMLIVGRCLVVTALALLASSQAFAQRGERGGGGWGGRDGGGDRDAGGYQQGGQNFNQGSPQHPSPAVEGRANAGGQAQGRVYDNERYGAGWQGEQRRGDRDAGRYYGYGRDWDRGWGPRWGWRGGYGYGYAWPGYYDGGYYGGNYYGNDYYGNDNGPVYDNQQADQGTYSDDNSEYEDEGGYYSRAVRAFEEGDYRTALRMAAHAEVDEPRNPNIHLLATLSMLALGDYRGAAMEAHAFSNIRQMPSWDTVYGFYGDVQPYTTQLRKLEKYVGAHPSAPESRFLLGFLYLTGGYRDAAAKQLQYVVRLSPHDRLATQWLRKAGGTVPAEIARHPRPGEDFERQDGYQQPGIQPQEGVEGQQGYQRQPSHEQQPGYEQHQRGNQNLPGYDGQQGKQHQPNNEGGYQRQPANQNQSHGSQQEGEHQQGKQRQPSASERSPSPTNPHEERED